MKITAVLGSILITAFGFAAMAQTSSVSPGQPTADLMAELPVINGITKIEHLDPQAASSCDVLAERIFYQMVRTKEQAKFADLLQKKMKLKQEFSSGDVLRLKGFANRLASRVPGLSANNVRLTIDWNLDALPAETKTRLPFELNSDEKDVKISDYLWKTTNGYLPDDLKVAYDEGTETLRLVYATNPVDACFGDSRMHLYVDLSGGGRLRLEGVIRP